MKVLIGFILVIALLLVPTMVSADCPEWGDDCCEYCGPCRTACCASLTFDYKVRYKEPVFLYFEQWGFGYWTSVWTEVIVEDVKDEDAAASSLGLRAGYDCWVTKVF